MTRPVLLVVIGLAVAVGLIVLGGLISAFSGRRPPRD